MTKSTSSPPRVHKFSGHIAGKLYEPPQTNDVTNFSSPKVDNKKHLDVDQHSFLIIQSSLTETIMAKTLSLTTDYEVWCNLEHTYRHDPKECMKDLKDSLHQLKKGMSIIFEFNLKFQAICD